MTCWTPSAPLNSHTKQSPPTVLLYCWEPSLCLEQLYQTLRCVCVCVCKKSSHYETWIFPALSHCAGSLTAVTKLIQRNFWSYKRTKKRNPWRVCRRSQRRFNLFQRAKTNPNKLSQPQGGVAVLVFWLEDHDFQDFTSKKRQMFAEMLSQQKKSCFILSPLRAPAPRVIPRSSLTSIIQTHTQP